MRQKGGLIATFGLIAKKIAVAGNSNKISVFLYIRKNIKILPLHVITKEVI